MSFRADCYFVVAVVELPLEERSQQHVLCGTFAVEREAMQVLQKAAWECHVQRIACIGWSLMSGLRVLREDFAPHLDPQGEFPTPARLEELRRCVVAGVRTFFDWTSNGDGLGVLKAARDYLFWSDLRELGVPVLGNGGYA